MAKLYISQTSFNAGSVSPELYGRIEISKYDNALETATNCDLLSHGPCLRRQGFKYIADVETHANKSRLVPFQVNRDISIMVEFGSSILRFITNAGVIQAGGGGDYSVVSPYSSSDLDNLSFQQSANSIYIAHKDYEPRILTRNSAADWDIKVVDFFPPATYEPGHEPDDTLTLGATSGTSINATASSKASFLKADVGRQIQEVNGPGRGLIVSVFDSAFVNSYFATDISGWANTSLGSGSIAWSAAGHINITYSSGIGQATATLPSLGAGTFTVVSTSKGSFLNWSVGTTSGGSQISNGSTLSNVSSSFSFTNPSQQTIYISFSSPSGTRSIDDIILSPASGTVCVIDITETFSSTTFTSGNWKMDLSPICDLKFEGTAVGALVEVRALNPEGRLGAGPYPISSMTFGNINTSWLTVGTNHSIASGSAIVFKDLKGAASLNDAVYTAETPFNGSSRNIRLGDSGNLQGIATNGNQAGTIQEVLTDVAIDAFTSDDIGKYILVNGGVLKIHQVITADKIKCQVIKSLNEATRSGEWTLESPTWSASRGYPKSVALARQRLIFASTDEQPQHIWFSDIDVLDSMATGPDSEDAIQVELSAKQVNEINWIAESRDVLLGTAGAEFSIAGSTTEGITPDTIKATARTSHGSEIQVAQVIGNEIVFVQSNRRKVRSMRYDFNIDTYISEDLTFLSSHLTKGLIKEIAYGKESNSDIYCVLEDGKMLVGTYVRTQEVIGWGIWETDGLFESVSYLESTNGPEIWVIVNRTINGSTKRYLEILDDGDGTDRLDGFSDSFLTYSSFTAITGITQATPGVVTSTSHGLSDGDKVKLIDVLGMTEANNKVYLVANKTTNTIELTDLAGNNIDTSAFSEYFTGGELHKLVSTVSGLDHLEGETVQVKADGASHPDVTVSSGTIALTGDHYELVIGMPYTTTIKTLPIDYSLGGQYPNMIGQKVRWIRPILKVHKSIVPSLNGNFKPSRSANDTMNTSVPLFSGDLTYQDIGWNNNNALTITVSDPYPFMLLGIFGTIEGNPL